MNPDGIGMIEKSKNENHDKKLFQNRLEDPLEE